MVLKENNIYLIKNVRQNNTTYAKDKYKKMLTRDNILIIKFINPIWLKQKAFCRLKYSSSQSINKYNSSNRDDTKR